MRFTFVISAAGEVARARGAGTFKGDLGDRKLESDGDAPRNSTRARRCSARCGGAKMASLLNGPVISKRVLILGRISTALGGGDEIRVGFSRELIEIRFDIPNGDTKIQEGGYRAQNS